MAFVLFFAVPALAAKVDLAAEHGKDLSKASFVVRYKFQKTTGVAWTKATYAQRRIFLEKWYADLEAERKRAAEEVAKKQEAQKQLLEDEKEKQVAEKVRLRKKAEEERQAQDEKKERAKRMAAVVRQREQQIRDSRH